MNMNDFIHTGIIFESPAFQQIPLGHNQATDSTSTFRGTVLIARCDQYRTPLP